MQVPFELAAFRVLRGHEPLARRPQLLDQLDVGQHQTGLGGHMSDQPLAGGGERLVRRHPDGDRAEEFALMQDRRGGLTGSGLRKLVPHHR